LDLKWNSFPLLYKSPNSIINHYPAQPYGLRLKKMKEDLKKGDQFKK